MNSLASCHFLVGLSDKHTRFGEGALGPGMEDLSTLAFMGVEGEAGQEVAAAV